VNQSLHRKYEESFHFFQVKWINELLDYSHHNPNFQDFVDMRISIDDTEFLKRFYYYKTPTGLSEIENRIKVCTGKNYDIKPSMRSKLLIFMNTR
jgi:hypothetical protein